jgi:long-chain acyl-CoA synthetase
MNCGTDTARLGRHDRTVLSAFTGYRQAAPDAAAVHYYGNEISRAELDDFSDRLAGWLAEAQVGIADRVAVSLQNTPAFAIALLATWKLGAVLVPVSPMLRAGELASLLSDCEAKVLLAHPEMADVITAALHEVDRRPTLLWSSPSDLAGELDAPWPAGHGDVPGQGSSLLLEMNRERRSVQPHSVDPDAVASLAYTSGTTGPSKGAMLTHANIGNQAFITPDWFGLTSSDSILTVAPFFHITGLCMHLALGLGNGLPLVMTYRFEPRHVLDLIQHYQPSFTVGTITAFIALAEQAATSEEGRAALSGLTAAYSGGAAVPAAVVDRYEREFGVYIRNGYGLTESASVCVAVPTGQRAPVDLDSGATSIGRPLPGVTVTIVADDGTEAPGGSAGEIVIVGPQVGDGYWNRSDETAHTFRPDGLRTGDIGIIDEQGWIYVVDRKKDLIVVSGYKVWPRDVEDVLYRHPSVAEAAVIGVPDSYRGETVAAFVVPRPRTRVTSDELDRHCREHLSAYKCPRRYEIVSELPKSASGKILRRLLRDDERSRTSST